MLQQVTAVATGTTERKVVIVCDDPELGGLMAMSLRLQGYLVEQTSPALASAPRWEPSFGSPSALLIDVESTERVSSGQLQRLLKQPWARHAPLLLAAEKAGALPPEIERSAVTRLVRPANVGEIVAALRALLDRPVPA